MSIIDEKFLNINYYKLSIFDDDDTIENIDNNIYNDTILTVNEVYNGISKTFEDINLSIDEHINKINELLGN
jgi:hypothetical protein|tara:strand:- start:101 stop:316 length:216 start_codon:yes stop_codon:yes gene_type:complete